ncbi:MAG: cysteine--tRNA ligase [Armatimonadetes bacterium 13_1_40CM_3_65_7]|nr:MAG: cysteine--tRNA ligase [Armatimonadetes bacterium 13_1_40CM_3_65_7]
MALRLHNTFTKRVEEFAPREPGRVRMYVCGPNLYGPAHVGHGFSYAFFDVLRRYLEYRGHAVTHVQNFTDIEDRIIERAVLERRNTVEIAQEYIDRFLRETDALGIRRAHHYPRASEMIPKIVEIIQGLIARGHAYRVDGDVYYRVTSFPRYLQLSGRSLDEMRAGARIEPDPRKEHPMDFVLWKAARPGEPTWSSPWGPGRPGWHIECSAMNLQYLGEQIDIHGGGEDLIFPHHENEIAQSEAYTAKVPFARYWLHNALMKPPVGDEMHRHLGNFVALRDALAQYEADGMRIFYLSAHYRTPLRWTDEAVRAAARGLERLRTALANAEEAIARADDREDPGLSEAARRAREAFERAMDDDVNTPQALAALFALAAEVNRVADAAIKGTMKGRAGLWVAADTLRELAQVLGLSLRRPGLTPDLLPDLHAVLAEAHREAAELFPEPLDAQDPEHLIRTLLEGRERARKRRAYEVADRVRTRLGGLGILVEDMPTGPRWRVASDGRRPPTDDSGPRG